MAIATVIKNNRATKARSETINNRKYTVVPVVMINEGVHTGSAGDLFYPKEELGKTPAVWNHVPVVVYHPEINGQGISACDPEVLQKQRIGEVYNTKFDDKGRLVAEVWVEEGRAEAVDKRVSDAIANNSMMEVSTGLFADYVDVAGVHNSETYDAIVTNIRPDHLAILPDKIGACSISDGAGLNRNEANKNAKQTPLVKNEISYETLRTKITSSLRATHTLSEDDYIYVEDIYSEFVIYYNSGKYYKQGYTVKNDVVTLSLLPAVEVERVFEYREVSTGVYVANGSVNFTGMGTEKMTKVQMIAALIANAASGWVEADRATLEAMPDAAVSKIHAGMATAPVQNGQPDVNKFLETAPAGIRELLTNALAEQGAKKTAMINQIIANKSNRFTAEFLQTQNLEFVTNLAAMLPAQQPQAPQAQVVAPINNGYQQPVPMTLPNAAPVYYGQQGYAPSPINNGQQLQHGSILANEAPVGLPVIDFKS